MKDLRKSIELTVYIYESELDGGHGRWISSVAGHWGRAKSTVSDWAKIAERLGLVRREGHNLYLTSKGRRLAELLVSLKLTGVDPSVLTVLFVEFRDFFFDLVRFLWDWLPSFPPRTLPPPYPPIPMPNSRAEELAMKELRNNWKAEEIRRAEDELLQAYDALQRKQG